MAKKVNTSENIAVLKSALDEIWSVKYLPKKIEDLACTDEIRDLLDAIIKTNAFPNHLCFYGTPGTGKNSIVNILKENLDVIMVVINASEENGIDDIRGKVLSFVNSGALLSKPKVLVMNEADGLTNQAQNSMREIMESKSGQCRFIFTCNSINSIIAPLQSRFSVYRIEPPITEIAKRLVFVLKNENVKFTREFIQKFIKIKGRDLRKLLNDAQTLSKTHAVLDADIFEANTNYTEFFDELFKTKDLKVIGEMVKTQLFEDDIYTVLAEYCLAKNFPSKTIPIVADHLYRSSMIFDKDLVFMSCLLTLKQIVNE